MVRRRPGRGARRSPSRTDSSTSPRTTGGAPGGGPPRRGLNRFVDGGDRGDEYNYCPPANDEIIDAPARPPRIRVTERGPARWTLEGAQTYSLPEARTA